MTHQSGAEEQDTLGHGEQGGAPQGRAERASEGTFEGITILLAERGLPSQGGYRLDCTRDFAGNSCAFFVFLPNEKSTAERSVIGA